MRFQLAPLIVACILSGQNQAQVPRNPMDPVSTTRACPVFPGSDIEEMRTQQIQVAEVTFLGSLQLPASEQQQIASLVKQRASGDSMDVVVDFALELAREGWQDRGYLKAQLGGESKTLTSNAVGRRILIEIQVDEGPQLRMGQITFKQIKAFRDVSLVRGLFPVQQGEIFRREKFGKGLENLRKAYDELGYINFVPVPIPTFDDQNQVVSFVIEIDEGKQFRVDKVSALGVDETFQKDLLKVFPKGQIYSERTFREFLERHASEFSGRFAPGDPSVIERHMDGRNGTISITLDARPCVANEISRSQWFNRGQLSSQ
jgi:hypothetical protein